MLSSLEENKSFLEGGAKGKQGLTNWALMWEGGDLRLFMANNQYILMHVEIRQHQWSFSECNYLLRCYSLFRAAFRISISAFSFSSFALFFFSYFSICCAANSYTSPVGRPCLQIALRNNSYASSNPESLMMSSSVFGFEGGGNF